LGWDEKEWKEGGRKLEINKHEDMKGKTDTRGGTKGALTHQSANISLISLFPLSSLSTSAAH
jgi:hypothetical protein